jgi:hypothetical protein
MKHKTQMLIITSMLAVCWMSLGMLDLGEIVAMQHAEVQTEQFKRSKANEVPKEFEEHLRYELLSQLPSHTNAVFMNRNGILPMCFCYSIASCIVEVDTLVDDLQSHDN